VKERKGFSSAEKQMMMLPRETLDGIYITGEVTVFLQDIYYMHHYSLIFFGADTVPVRENPWRL